MTYRESSCNKHLLEVGVFSILNQLQQNSLCGGEVSSALLQSGQSKQTVCLAVEGGKKVVTHMYTVSTHAQKHRDKLIFIAGNINDKWQKNREHTDTFWKRQRQPQYEPPSPFRAGQMLYTVERVT